MSKIYDKAYMTDTLKVPHHLVRQVMDTPRLLPGESRADYFLLFEAMLDELMPKASLEWLLCIELAWIMWDIQRLRRWKNAIIAVNQRYAVEEALRLTHEHWGMTAPSPTVRMEIHKELKAAGGDWKSDKKMAVQLATGDYDDEALNATAFLEAPWGLATIENS